MSATLFTSIRNYITTKLTTITAIQYSDNCHHYKLPGYPAVTFEPSSGTNEVFNTKDNLRGYAFDFYVQCEMTNGRDNAVKVMCIVLDALLDSFDSDYTLGGLLDYSIPMQVESVVAYENGDGPVLVGKLTLIAKKEINVLP